MSLLLLTTFSLTALLPFTAAHGRVTGIVADGTYYPGYQQSDDFLDPFPAKVAWSTPGNWDSGFIGGVNYTDPQINCHRYGYPGNSTAKVTAGSAVELQWTHWPNSHHGPVLDYLAKCPGPCKDVADVTELNWFKIGAAGCGFAPNETYPLGWWATSLLNWNNDSWAITIPPTIASGEYILRHEIIALHGAGELNGAQNYPQCVNLEVISSGTDEPEGVKGTDLYHPEDPGLDINIWMQVIKTYTLPGPTLYSGAVTMSSLTTYDIDAYAPTTPTSGSAPATAAPVKKLPKSNPFPYPIPPSSTSTGTPLPSPLSQIAAIASAVPVEYITSTITAAVPASPTTTSASVNIQEGEEAEFQWGEEPEKPIPSGYTLKDLLEWTAYTVKQAWKEGGKSVHQRDFGAFV